MAYRRRPHRSPHPSILTFHDALAEALALHRRFGFAHAAALLDDRGRVLDLTAFTDRDRHRVDTALDWASCMIADRFDACVLVVFSAGDVDPSAVAAHDVDLFLRLREAYARAGVELRDWILTDGENLRSMAFTTDPDTAWADVGSSGGTVTAFPGARS